MRMKNYIGLFFTGFGIGIFLGLSESPILLQVLIPLLTVIVGLLSILTGQKDEVKPNESEPKLLNTKNISTFPIMWMVLGMVAGAFGGLYAKNHDITGTGVLFGNKVSSQSNQIENSLESKTDAENLPENKVDLQTPKPDIETASLEKENSLEDKNARSPSKKQGQIFPKTEVRKSSTFLRDNEKDRCNSLDLCNKNGPELVYLASKFKNKNIIRLLKGPSINLDSLKSKIIELCNCKE